MNRFQNTRATEASESSAEYLLKRFRDKSIELEAQLSSIVVSSEHMHRLLPEDVPQQVYIVEGIGQHFKVYLKEKSPPCVVSLNYNNLGD